jgi:hypothetical protein
MVSGVVSGSNVSVYHILTLLLNNKVRNSEYLTIVISYNHSACNEICKW